MMENLRVAFGDTPLGPWGQSSDPFTDMFNEGPTVLRRGDEWIIYYDMYEKHRYGAVKTRDFKTFTDIADKLSFPKDHRHGTVFAAPSSVLVGLKQHCGLD